jgi:hypothetical protein
VSVAIVARWATVTAFFRGRTVRSAITRSATISRTPFRRTPFGRTARPESAGAALAQLAQTVTLLVVENLFQTSVNVLLQVGKLFALLVGKPQHLLNRRRQNHSDPRGAECFSRAAFSTRRGEPVARRACSTRRTKPVTGAIRAATFRSAGRTSASPEGFRFAAFESLELIGGDDTVFVDIGAGEEAVDAFVGEFFLLDLAVAVFVELHHSFDEAYTIGITWPPLAVAAITITRATIPLWSVAVARTFTSLAVARAFRPRTVALARLAVTDGTAQKDGCPTDNSQRAHRRVFQLDVTHDSSPRARRRRTSD